MTNIRMTVRDDCAVCWSPLLPSIKTLVHWLLVGERGVSLQTEVPPPHSSHYSHLLASKTRQTFLFTSLASLLTFEWHVARLPYTYFWF